MLEQEQDDRILEFSTGVKLKLSPPSELLVSAAMKKIAEEEPKVPRVWSQDKERDEDNPNDPDYKRSYLAWVAEAGVRALRALIPTGTSIEHLPDDMVGPESEEFPDLMEAIGQDVAPGRHSRYVQWVMYIAPGAGDLDRLGQRLMRMAGVREEDVSEALEMFPGLAERRADNASPAGRGGADGNSVSRSSAGPGT